MPCLKRHALHKTTWKEHNLATKYAEVIYETGDHSIASYDDTPEGLDDFLKGLENHHRRAVNGEAGGPTLRPAERIKKVLTYDEHPGDYMLGGLVDTSVLKSHTSEMIDKIAVGNQASVWELISELRQYMTALKPNRDKLKPHESWYKMNETGELELEL